MPRLFLAVWPPPAVLDALWALPRPEREGVRWVPRHDLHVTLRFLGEAAVEAALEALAGVTFPGGEASLGPGVERLAPHVVTVPVHGLDDLATVVTATTVDIGRPPEDRGFRGHVTLARLRPGAEPPLLDTPVSLRFPVEEVALVASETRATGATYRTIHRFPATG